MKRAALLAGAAIAAAGTLPGTSPAVAKASAPASPESTDRVLACYFWSYVTVVADAPYRTGGDVKSEGSWEQSPVYCPYPTGKVAAQTKVCGGWGCSWETRGSSGDVTLSSSPIYRSAKQDCRNGTNRYRTRTYYTAVNLDYEGTPAVPVLSSSTSSVDDNKQPEFTC